MDLTHFYEPLKQLVGDYDLTERMAETARLYFNNNSINVNPFGSIFEAFVLAAVLVALLSYIIEVKVEKSSDYGLETRSDAEYQPYLHKLQKQVWQFDAWCAPFDLISDFAFQQVADLEQVADLQDAIEANGGINSFDYTGYSGLGYSD